MLAQVWPSTGRVRRGVGEGWRASDSIALEGLSSKQGEGVQRSAMVGRSEAQIPERRTERSAVEGKVKGELKKRRGIKVFIVRKRGESGTT